LNKLIASCLEKDPYYVCSIAYHTDEP